VDELQVLRREHDRLLERIPLLVLLLPATDTDTTAAADALATIDESSRLWNVLLHAALGHDDRAFEILDEVYPRDDVPWDYWSTVYLRYFLPATLGSLRDDPRFDRFLERMHTHWGLNPDGSLPEGVDVSFPSQADE
jgi:hypothetical protein